MREITIKACAKINPSLDILGQRSDGYHELDMVMQLIELHDHVCIQIETTTALEEAKTTEEKPIEKDTSIRLTCSDATIPCDQRNLAHRAAALMLETWKESRCGEKAVEEGLAFGPMDALQVTIHIEKKIPVAAGMAGGSADGAAVFLGLNVLLGLHYDLETLCSLGARLGADIPFSIRGMAKTNPQAGLATDPLASTCARATGIGTRLEALPPLKAYTVTSTPPIQVSTPEVYRGYDELLKEQDVKSHPLVDDAPQVEQVVAALKVQQVPPTQALGNVLEKYTVTRYDEVKNTKKYMKELSKGRGMVLMSGSGPTVFFMTQNLEAAETMWKALRDAPLTAQNATFLTRTETGGKEEDE